jgi:putative ABC transport system permease protein
MPLSWPVLARLLRRRVPTSNLEIVVGDLLEDFRRDRLRIGWIRAEFHVALGAFSIARFYRRAALDRHQPHRASGQLVESMWQDVMNAWRRLAQAPLLTVVAVVTLALGIGANAAIFSVMDAVMFHPLPYRDPNRLLQLWSTHPDGSRTLSIGAEAVRDWAARDDVFSDVEPYVQNSVTLMTDRDARQVFSARVGGGLMAMLGVRAQLGRQIEAADAQPWAEPVVVLSDGLWRQAYGSDPTILGRRVRIDAAVSTVVGVMPPSFRFPFSRQQLWQPLLPATPRPTGRSPNYFVLVRLAPGLTPALAQTRLDAADASNRAPGVPAGSRITVESPLAGRVPGSTRQTLFILMGAVGLVLLIACANVANLLLESAWSRAREQAVRIALGATRGRLVRASFFESAVLVTLGGLAALLLATWAVTTIRPDLPSDLTALRPGVVGVNGDAVLFTGALLIAAVVFCGALPALRTSAGALTGMLQSGGRSLTLSRSHTIVGGAFVVAQLAASTALLTGAMLLIHSFVHVVRVNPGFEVPGLVAIDVVLPTWKYPTRAAKEMALDRIGDELRRVPGVREATLTSGIAPTGGGLTAAMAVEIDGHGVVLADRTLYIPVTDVDHNFFATLGIPIARGRAFDSSDRANAPLTTIISESLARRFWPREDPIGGRVRLAADAPWYTIVGVAGDVYQFDIAQTHGGYAMYFPRSQATDTPTQPTLVFRASGSLTAAIGSMRAQLHAIDPELPIQSISTVEDLYGQFFSGPRFYAALMSGLAVVGQVVAAIGLFGVLASLVARRRRELGIRLVVGASPSQVVRLVLRHAAGLCVIGLGAGIGLGIVIGRSLRAVLVDVSPADPWAYVSVCVMLALVTTAAAWIPAHRAARIDPVRSLRFE